MKLCNKCNKTWPDEFNLCPVCGGELVVEQTQPSDTISMGDGNAINGGINFSKDFSRKDDHSVTNSNNTSDSHNTTNSHNQTTNFSSKHIYNGNYTKIEREKTAEEILIERKQNFRKCCKKVLDDGLLTREDRIWLEEQRSHYGLSAEIADHILNEVSSTHQRSVMSMGTVQRIQFNNFKRAVEGNCIENVKKYLPQIGVIAEKFQEEELQFLYHLALAALYPQECVEKYINRQEDKYWLTFWVYVALHKLGDISNAENALIDLGKWQGLMPDENIVILGAFGALMENDKLTADELFNHAISGECSPLLNNLAEVMSAIINYDPNDAEIITTLSKHRFYVKHFLEEVFETEKNELKQKEEAARKAKEEAERKAREEAERKAREEAERKAREEAERKAREEAERKAREEAERKAREEAERKAREEAERKAREEAERKAREEAERKAREEAERKAREEAERIARKEAARKAQEEAWHRAREEAERKSREKAERKAREEAERKARREAERVAREKAEEEMKRRAAEDAERKIREEVERKAREEAERKAREEAKRKAEEEAKAQLRFCKKCGKQVAIGVSFCKHCGAKLLPNASASAQKPTISRICPKCNTSQSVGASFCKKCGYKL